MPTPSQTPPNPRESAEIDPAGSLLDLMATVKGLEEQLVRAQRMAMLGTAAGMIAHEVNNIMTPVQGMAELALRSPGDAALARKALERAAAGAARAAEVVAAVMAFSEDRQVVGRSTETPSDMSAGSGVGLARGAAARLPNGADGEPVSDAVACARRVAEWLEPGLRREGVRCEVVVEGAAVGGVTPVRMRAMALEQVLMNLVLNAQRAVAGRGGGVIEIVVGGDRGPNGRMVKGPNGQVGTPDAAGWVGVRVSDNGCGMDAATVARVFGAARGAADADARGAVLSVGPVAGAAGRGYGVLVCRRLVEQAGGVLEAESVVGAGTAVTVWVGGGK